MKALALLLVAGVASAAPARVPEGSYRTPFPASPADRAVRVPAFWLDREPVTNREFLAFVAAHPEWRRDRVQALYADRGYLAHWAGADVLGDRARPGAPVVRVSWFAARAFCAARGGRLPTEAEWERAASAPRTRDDLSWYEAPAPDVLGDAAGAPNAYGISDLHALVWEWVEDFGATLMAPEPGRSCGAAATGAVDPQAYAAFLRYSFRSSLDARFAVGSLGFRCAYDREKP